MLRKELLEKTFKFDFDLFNSLQDMCFILSDRGEILDMNISAVIKLEIMADHVEGKKFISLIDTEYVEPVRTIFENCVKYNKSGNIYAKFLTTDKKLDANIVFTPSLQSINGVEHLYFFVIAHDITEEKKREMDLLRFYKVAENTVNPLQITDINGRMIYVNPAFVEASGYSREELLGKRPNIFGSGKNSKKFWKRMWDTINTGKVWVGEIENRKKNGEPFYTQLLVSPILGTDGKIWGFFGVHRDLSEKRMMEKQLIHTQKMESIGTLAAGIAHEVGNPLASISALVQVVLRTTSDDFVKDKLGLVKSQVTRISKIIRDLVDFSRPSDYELQVININDSIKEAVEIVKVGARAKDVDFVLQLENDMPLLPLISDQIQQVFINILINAVDSMSEDPEKTKKKQIIIQSHVDNEKITLKFADTGSGIEEKNYSKIFEPFYTTKKPGKGTGLGLWVSYGIIKSFQGNIEVESKFGEGTTFIITLPLNT
ncbi:MAG TPA: PAS domain S-box protein [Ignavibacteriaceae bacterium]|nr:PAS domain S-box protein [Ignavibacteriaceae bacterium]